MPRERLTIIGGAGRVTLYLAAMDGSGRSTPIRTVARDVPPAGDFTEHFELAMRPGEQVIVVGARDDASGALSLVRLDVNL